MYGAAMITLSTVGSIQAWVMAETQSNSSLVVMYYLNRVASSSSSSSSGS